MAKRNAKKAKSMESMGFPQKDSSKQLAETLLRTLNVKSEVIAAFKQDEVYKTISANQDYSIVSSINKEELKIVAELVAKGFVVYHVVPSIINFDGLLMRTVAYLLIPTNVIESAGYLDENLKSDKERNAVIKRYMSRQVGVARQGIVFAYVVNKDWGVAEFGDVLIRNISGGLVRIG